MIPPTNRNGIPFHSTTRRNPGFSLIELLVVIAILAVLAAIIIPVVGNVRTSAQTTHCLSNLRQLGVGTSLYLSDNDQVFPPASYWPQEIGPYIDAPWNRWSQPLPDSKNPFLCPSAVHDEITPNYSYQLSYGINCESVADKNVHEVMQRSPDANMANTLLYADCGEVNLWNWALHRFNVNWHPTGVNAVYADFHVEKTGITSMEDPRLAELLD